MSKQPYRFRTMRWRWIYLTMFLEWVVFSVMTLLFWQSAPFWIFMAIFGGWQMGALSERNEWTEWYYATDTDSLTDSQANTNHKSEQA